MWPCSRCRTGRRQNGSSGRLSPSGPDRRTHQKRESASEGGDLASGPVPQHRGESCVLQAVRPCGKIQDHGKVYRLRGLCKALSLSNIRLEDGSPVWGSDCTHCMACICRCPEQAIEYGKASLGNPDTNVREPGREIGGRKKIYKKFAGTPCKF